ncbi:hypothetical protein EU528_08430 [Candidatus Thorarchaeota archaeon]|nr:MAG: hypothetical protein EU528_08430 [Candidatus Thorarchaeota archaeon]
MKPRFYLVTLLLCLLFLSSLRSSNNVDQGIGVDDLSSQLIESPYLQAYEDHGPIVVAGDDNLTAWGFPGSGSGAEPYRIEGYNFTLNGTAISVTNISLYLVINGCWIQSAGDKAGSGIYFENVTSGQIENCTIKDKTYGVHIFESDSCTINDIDVTGTVAYGVVIDTSTDCEIDQSYIHHVSNVGIYDDSTRTDVNDTIIQYTTSHCIYSIGTNITVDSCDISYSSTHTIRNEAWYSVFNNNTIYHSSGYGVYERMARYNTWTNNRIFGHNSFGFYFYTSRYSTFTGNSVFNNGVYNLLFSESFTGTCTVINNKFGWTTTNALDDADYSNSYDNGINLGNAWSDYAGSPPYLIGGLQGGVDSYPTLLEDNVTPSILSAPADVVQFNHEDRIITWILDDEEFPDTQTILVNGSGSANKWDGRDIELNLGDLVVGIHNITLVVLDCGGNIASDTVIVEVYDFTIDNPPDIVMELGTTGNIIEWFARSGAQDVYEIYVNSGLILTIPWDTWNITYNIDGLLTGLNEVEIRVYNASGGFLSDVVLVYVEDTVYPVISNLGLYYLEKDSLLTLEWSTGDLNPDRLTLLKNGSSILNASWQFPIFSYEIVGNEIGIWNYSLVIIDLGGNIAIDTAIVVVRDTSPTTTTTSTLPITNNTQFVQLENQLFIQTIAIVGIGILTIVSLVFNVMVLKKIGKKGK